MRRLNVIFLAILTMAMAFTGGGLYGVHGIQMRRNASALLERARAAEAQNDLAKVEESLGWYLNLRRDDGPVWAWYAQVVDQGDTVRRQAERVFLVHEEALRHNSGDRQLERRCAKLAMGVGRHGDARRLLTHLLEGISEEPQDHSKAAERAELEEFLGQCDRAMARYEDAENWFVLAIKHDQGRVDCFDQLARLRRVDLRRKEAGDETIREMIAKNNGSGRAYIYRWRYARAYAPPADASDIPMALKLAPEDPEVLFTAAGASEEKQDVASARAYFEKGFEIAPKNSAFALGLASLEVRENHLDQAAAALRRGYQANPSLDVAFELAEILILQNKIDGNEQATDSIARLRKAGLSDTYLGYLEARILFQQKKWAEAIPRLEMAKTVLRSDPRLMPRLELMLAECYGRMGLEERRLDALRSACEGHRGPEPARIELAQGLARSGKLDQAIGVLLPLIERKPELRLELVRLFIRKASREPARPGNWEQVEAQLRQAEKALPRSVEPLTLVRGEVLTARNRLDDARSLLNAAQAKEPGVLSYRLALTRLAQRQGRGGEALQILDQAEKDLGPGLAIQLARLDYWNSQGGDDAKAAVAKLVEGRQRIPTAELPSFLDRLVTVEIRLGELPLARQHWRELAAFQPHDLRVLLGLFSLAMGAADHVDALDLVSTMSKVEGEPGTYWRLARATFLIDQARRTGNRARKVTRADLDVIRGLASEIAERRPDWWGAPLLQAEIAEFEGRDDDVVSAYQRAIDLGNSQPVIVRRLIGLLSNRNRFDDIERLVTSLQDRGIAAEDLAIATAFNAIRKKDYERGLALARQVIPARSTRYSDHLTLGRILMTSGKVEEAGKEFRRAIELAPSVPETWRSWVEYLARTNQAQAARAAAGAAEKALPPVASTLTLAQCHWSAGEASKAETLFLEAIEDRPHDAATLRLAANFFLAQNLPDRAAPLVAKLFKPENRASRADVTWAKRSRMMLDLASGVTPERVEQALRLVEQDLKSDPDDFDAHRIRAVLLSTQYSRRKESIRALESLDRAVELAPRERFLLATLYSSERDWPKCRSEMRKILEDKSRQPRYLVYHVDLMTRLGELDEAEKWLRALKPLVPADSTGLMLDLEARLLRARKQDLELAALIRNHSQQNPAQLGIAAVLFERFGLLKEAEQAYRADVARNPDEIAKVLALIEFLARQDRPQEALDLGEPAMRTWRPEPMALASLAIYKAKSATEPQRRKVEARLQELVHHKPDDLVLNMRLAALRTLQGNYTEAEAIYQRVLRADRNNVEALNNLAWQLALRENSPEEALQLVDRALDIVGSNPTLLDTRAVVLMRLSQGDKALEALLEADSSQPDKPTRYFHLAQAYRMTNAPSQARMALERSKMLGLNEEIIDPLERETYRKLGRAIALR